MSVLEAAEIRSFLTAAAHPLPGGSAEYDPLLDAIGDAAFVLLGEASFGTHEFHRARVEITKRLIREKGFRGVAVEADGADARRVDRFVRGSHEDADAAFALGNFRRFPAWEWRNADVIDFVDWLRAHNDGLAEEREKAGFYGLDVYSLHASTEAVLECLGRGDADAARRAEARHACFDRFGGDAQGWGAAATFGHGILCEDGILERLVEGSARSGCGARLDGACEEALLRDAPAYYRALFGSPVLPWNLRDRHMAETLDALADRLSADGGKVKLVVWAHNAHLGDARATEMGEHGELSLGELVRARRGADAFLVGFTTDSGTVTAASAWDGPARRRRLRPALAGSYEALFHEVRTPRFLLDLHGSREIEVVLSERRLERAVGAVYRPETERRSHYFLARLPAQFDAVVHFDETRAVEPLELTADWLRGDPPEHCASVAPA
jgi:erythromycin esterase-like protein